MPASAIEDYAIRPGYVVRETPDYFVDASPLLHQPDVYEWAYWKAREFDLKALVDVGCGRAGKLAAIYPRTNRWRITGIDHGPNIEWCAKHWPWGDWLALDLDLPHFFDATDALVICSDVIEHLRRPEHLLRAIHESGCRAAVFTTPERELAHGKDHNGPPPNTSHVREWSAAEFDDLLERFGFRILHSGLTTATDGDIEPETILALAEPA